MATNRLEILRQMTEQDPQNLFARYGLAMELVNGGQLENAVREFEAILASDETYAAAYFHAGQTFEKLGRIEDARAVYEKGIEMTARTGDAHTRAEIQAALSLLPI